jgi:ribulose-phosphate 3-epimerase
MPEPQARIAPSILACDFARLGEQIAAVEKVAEQYGVDRLHVDVMDGIFVPNISFGMPVLKSIARAARLPLETHLMIDRPERYLEAFVEAGATSLLVHVEGADHLHRTIERIKQLGVKAGVVLNPATPAAAVEEILLPKIQRMRQMIHELNVGCELEVDGGIDAETARDAVSAGAGVLVAGSAVFGAPDGIEAALRRMSDALGTVE